MANIGRLHQSINHEIHDGIKMMCDGKNMRVTIVGPIPPPMGGISNQTLQLVGLLKSEGFNVITIRSNDAYKPKIIAKIRVFRAFYRLIPYVFKLLFATRKTDVFHVMANSGWSWYFYAMPAILIARLCGVPVVVNYRGGNADKFLAASLRYVKPILTMSSEIVVPSKYLMDVFAKYGIKCTIVPNIINKKIFYPKNDPRPFSKINKQPVICIARNLDKIYGVDVGIKAFALLKKKIMDAKLYIAGDGPEKDYLEKLAIKNSIENSVNFTGSLSRDEIAELYRNSDLMLNPTYVDNMPNSILEGFSCGLPVVTTNVGGIPFIADHNRTALLVEKGDHVGLFDAMYALLSDEKRYFKMSAEAHIESSVYTWDKVKNKLIEIYMRTISKKLN